MATRNKQIIIDDMTSSMTDDVLSRALGGDNINNDLMESLQRTPVAPVTVSLPMPKRTLLTPPTQLANVVKPETVATSTAQSAPTATASASAPSDKLFGIPAVFNLFGFELSRTTLFVLVACILAAVGYAVWYKYYKNKPTAANSDDKHNTETDKRNTETDTTTESTKSSKSSKSSK